MSFSEARVRSATIDGRQIVWRELGDGPAVMLLHSGGLSGRQWRRLAEALEPRFRVVVPDLLGYGASDRWPVGEPFQLSSDLAALELVLDTVDGTPHLVGHSYGGFLALQLMLADTTRFGRAALFEPTAFAVLNHDEDSDALATLHGVEMSYQPSPETGVDEKWLRAFVEWWNGVGAWDALSDEVRETFRRAGWKTYQEVTALIADQTPLQAYRRLSNETLLLGGSRSPLAEQRVVTRLASAIPNGKLHIFEELGHLAPMTNAAAVNEMIVRFIES